MRKRPWPLEARGGPMAQPLDGPSTTPRWPLERPLRVAYGRLRAARPQTGHFRQRQRIDRGYERFVEKLRVIEARIERQQNMLHFSHDHARHSDSGDQPPAGRRCARVAGVSPATNSSGIEHAIFFRKWTLRQLLAAIHRRVRRRGVGATRTRHVRSP